MARPYVQPRAEEGELLGVHPLLFERCGQRVSASCTRPRESSPRWARSSVSAVVANRVCTTDFSSAKGSATVSSEIATAGVSGSPMTVTVGIRPLTASSTRSTSVVVPERVIATTAS